jgi:hypothetical protein
VPFLAGTHIERGCTGGTANNFSAENKQVKGLQEFLAGREFNDIVAAFCDSDLCSGSSRLTEISPMVILLPTSLVFLISFFSRL